MNGLSKAQEGFISVLTGALGAPIAAGVYWLLFKGPTCDPDFLSGSRDCVVTAAGESRSWIALASTPVAVVFGFVLAGIAYVVLDVLIDATKRREPAR